MHAVVECAAEERRGQKLNRQNSFPEPGPSVGLYPRLDRGKKFPDPPPPPFQTGEARSGEGRKAPRKVTTTLQRGQLFLLDI